MVYFCCSCFSISLIYLLFLILLLGIFVDIFPVLGSYYVQLISIHSFSISNTCSSSYKFPLGTFLVPYHWLTCKICDGIFLSFLFLCNSGCWIHNLKLHKNQKIVQIPNTSYLDCQLFTFFFISFIVHYLQIPKYMYISFCINVYMCIYVEVCIHIF